MSAWPAPAKLNLCLHITGRRADGYHELQTLFQFIDLCDELIFSPRADGRIRRSGGAAEVRPEEDLVVRAAEALRAAAPDAPGIGGVDIHVLKRIPLGAGLGGGSSDAATTLLALNQLWDLKLPPERLAQIGLELGADVPVFVHGRAAWAEGVGERLQFVDPPEPIYFLIRPPVAVSTREIFQAPELTRNSAPSTIRAVFDQGGRNDCEPTVRARYPLVAAALDWLNLNVPETSAFDKGPLTNGARLTGTGSCVFAAIGSVAQGEELLEKLPSGWQGFVVKGLNRSPLLGKLALPAVP